MSTGDWQEQEEPNIEARSLTLSREVGFDPAFPYSPYILRGPLSLFRTSGPFPVIWQDPMFLYAEYFGDAGEYEVWFDLVRFVVDEDDEIADEFEDTCYGPFSMTMPPGVFIQGRSYPLRILPFQAAGLHEFRLRIAGVYNVLACVRFMVEG